MPARHAFQHFARNDEGGILVFWAAALVVFLGLAGLVFDMGRLASTQSELQSFADSVSLAAAAELDGRADSLDRAEDAAFSLITGSQTYGDGARDLVASDVVTLTFYQPDATGGFTRAPSLETTNPYRARYVAARVADQSVTPGLGAAFAVLFDGADQTTAVSAQAVAGFALEACNVAPVAVCLPALDFDASASIGTTLDLQASVGIGQLLPGQIAAVDTLTDVLDGLQVCAGLFGRSLEACLLAARAPETACSGGSGGLSISANLTGTDLLDSLNTRFGRFTGIASGLVGQPEFSGAPNVLTGLTNQLGLCLPIPLPSLGGNIGLPGDDCIESGTCAVQGDGEWALGRQAYVEAHYDGTDPFPTAETRFEFYQAEIAAAATVGPLPGVGGLVGGLLGGFTPQLCAPQADQDPTRRVMVVAGIDCLSAAVDVGVSAPPVQQFFEVFTLGPGEGGRIQLEITACLGGDCGGGTLGTDVRDIVRLVE